MKPLVLQELKLSAFLFPVSRVPEVYILGRAQNSTGFSRKHLHAPVIVLFVCLNHILNYAKYFKHLTKIFTCGRGSLLDLLDSCFVFLFFSFFWLNLQSSSSRNDTGLGSGLRPW